MTRALLLLPALAAGCAHSPTLEPDHGRSYHEAFAAQAQREGPPPEATGYVLLGDEALSLRENMYESLTDEPGKQPLVINLNQ